MPRILFEKKGDAVWISHLDLMRVFQRAFKRAGMPLKHTQGFNPRPSVSIALPLSVGVQSRCELLDFDLDGVEVPCEEIMERLNQSLIPNVRVLTCYPGGRKIGDLRLLQCRVVMVYDRPLPADAAQTVDALFRQDSLEVEKKTKSGLQEQNIIPMIRTLEVTQTGENTIVLDARIYCQNPTLNPMQLCAAVTRYLPAYAPDFSTCERIEIYDEKDTIFR